MSDDLIRDMMDEEERSVSQKVKGMRCPEHGETATVTTRRHGNELEFEIKACCDAFHDAITAQLD